MFVSFGTVLLLFSVCTLLQIGSDRNQFNNYRCVDGTIKPCSSSKYGYAPAAMEAVSVFSVACFLIVITLLLIVLLGSVVYVIRFVCLNIYRTIYRWFSVFIERIFQKCFFISVSKHSENVEQVSHSRMRGSTNALK